MAKNSATTLSEVKEKHASKVNFIFSLFTAPNSKEQSDFLVATHCFTTYAVHLQIFGI